MRGLIEVSASGFSGNYLSCNGTQNIWISKADIFLSLLTVGTRGTRDFLSLPRHVLNARRGRAIFARNFITVENGLWIIHNEYRAQDRSEKVVLSYWLGISFAKIVASRLLGTSWLAHVDALIADNVLVPSNIGRERPDLAGHDRQNNWHIVEAKGRSVFIEPNLMQSAKNQAMMIDRAQGSVPQTRSGCIVKLFSSPIQVEIDDPEGNQSKTSWEINMVRFYDKYYSTIIHFIQNNERSLIEVNNLAYLTTEISLFGQRIKIGLLNDLFMEPASIVEMTERLDSIVDYSKESPPNISIGRDGTYLEVITDYD
ncbi:hypothetical protein ACFL6E_02415 [Candidatus Neomarinimicrobiota bacterium]